MLTIHCYNVRFTMEKKRIFFAFCKKVACILQPLTYINVHPYTFIHMDTSYVLNNVILSLYRLTFFMSSNNVREGIFNRYTSAPPPPQNQIKKYIRAGILELDFRGPWALIKNIAHYIYFK